MIPTHNPENVILTHGHATPRELHAGLSARSGMGESHGPSSVSSQQCADKGWEPLIPKDPLVRPRSPTCF